MVINELTVEQLETAANMLKAIAHPTRIAILNFLEDGQKRTVTEIHEKLQIELGRELAAQKVITTRIVRIGKSCQVTALIYDLRTASSESASSEETSCEDEDLLDAVREISVRFCRPLMAAKYARREVSGVVWRSAILPGWGQIHRGEIAKGTAVAISECLLLAGGIVGMSLSYHYADMANSASSQGDQDWFNERKEITWWFSIGAFAGFGVVYIYNIIDALVGMPAEEDVSETHLVNSLFISPTSGGLSVSLFLRF